ncbi:MAG: MFS transporter, partial [Acidimicrobiia bacterium]|nr:MFS transporter [Acidimicrobiia bacterium]
SHGRPLTMAVGFALLTVSPLLTLSGVAPLVIAAAVSFGLCVSGTPTAIGAVVADHLSGRSFGAAFGTLTLTFSTAQVLGPYFAGKMADLTGDFTVPFLVASAVGVAGAVCALAMRRAAPLALAMPPDAEAGAAIRPR